MTSTSHVIVVGAGIGGMAAAVDLASRGYAVTVVEAADTVGGKMHQVTIGDAVLDGGPSVITMRWVFEDLFARAGARLNDYLQLTALDVIARHAWTDGSRLDLFADMERSYEAIRAFSSAREAEGFRRFCAYAKKIYEAADSTFISSQRPTPAVVIKKLGLSAVPLMLSIDSRRSVWRALGDFFTDARLRQLFARYATYAGNSPFLAPATFNLIAHVESQGVWVAKGGMYALAQAMRALLDKLHVAVYLGEKVEEVLLDGGRARGVRLASGAILRSDAVVFNGDVAALRRGLLGLPVRRAVKETAVGERSLSALTFCMLAKSEGFPLTYHNVFFSEDYESEFRQIFDERRLPTQPTTYICAQDRLGNSVTSGPERLFILVNAPPFADSRPLRQAELHECEEQTFQLVQRCGLTIHKNPQLIRRTDPAMWAERFPGTGGAIYGPASHNSMATLKRPGASSEIPGLYLTGGSIHPGAGVPMVTLSGMRAGEQIAADMPLMRSYRQMVTAGGTSMA